MQKMLGVAAFFVIVMAAGSAAAQPAVPETGGRVYGLVGGGFGDGHAVASGAGAGIRLTRHLGLDVELTHLTARDGAADTVFPPWFGNVLRFDLGHAGPGHLDPGHADPGHLDPGIPEFPADYPLLPFPVSFEDGGRDVTAFLTKFTVEFPIADGRLFPYLTGGGGVGRVTERAVFFFPGLLDQTQLGLALTLGGGVDVRLWRGFGVGVDLRWLRVLHSYDTLDTAQVAARASYRF